jgi:hypothetical protein
MNDSELLGLWWINDVSSEFGKPTGERSELGRRFVTAHTLTPDFVLFVVMPERVETELHALRIGTPHGVQPVFAPAMVVFDVDLERSLALVVLGLAGALYGLIRGDSINQAI